MAKNILIIGNDLPKYERGEIALAINTNTGERLQVQKNKDGVMCQVISNLKPYTELHMCFSGANVLNASSEETREAVRTGIYEGDHFSSSGARNEKGEPLSLAEQIKKGVARKTHILIKIKDMAKVGSTNEEDYDRLVVSDSCNELRPL